MKEILMVTTNQAKIDQISGALTGTGIAIIGIKDKSLLPEVEENGDTALENAKIKALAYAAYLNRIVAKQEEKTYIAGNIAARKGSR